MHRNNNPIARKSNLVIQEMEAELLIFDLGTNKAFCLNETSALIWQYSDGRNSVADIAGLMSERFKTPVTDEFVWLALDHLKKDNLLENSAEFEINFNGLKRREVIKKIGFASMIALPVVSSVIAPSSAFAASGTNCPPLGTCIPAGSVICPAGCNLRVNCQLVQAMSTCTGPPYAPQPGANVNCLTSPGFTFPPADCNVNLSPA
jgi:hypothetical protein